MTRHTKIIVLALALFIGVSAAHFTGWSAQAVERSHALGRRLTKLITSDHVTRHTAAFSPLAAPVMPPVTITVKSNADAGGTCPGATCTLRQAIATANSGDTIDFDLTTVVSPITLTTGELLINKSLTITGPGANLLTVSGNNASRVFHIAAGSFDVTLSGLTMANGRVTGSSALGGGIFNESTGTLNITGSTLSGNSASASVSNSNNFSAGGGIYNFTTGTVNVTNSTLSGNSASASGSNSTIDSQGGGIYTNGGTVNVTNSTLSGNSASGSSGPTNASKGGGIYTGGGTVNVTNSTLSGNSASASGGSFGQGGGIFRNTGTVNAKNTIIAKNTALTNDPDVFGTFTSQGFNLIGDGTGSTGFTSTGDQVGTSGTPINPLLGALQNNGGPTQTMRPQPTSPAINTGTNAGAPATDQRGVLRPQNGTVDIGAVEVIQESAGMIQLAVDPAGNPSGAAVELIEAILAANDNSSATTIKMLCGTYTLTTRINADFGFNGLPSVTSPITIQGNGAIIERSSASGTPTFRLFFVAAATGNLMLENVTLRNGLAKGGNGEASSEGGGGGGAGLGGAVYNRGKLTVVGSTLTGNTAQGGNGGNSSASGSGQGGGELGGAGGSGGAGGFGGGGGGGGSGGNGGNGGFGGGGGGGGTSHPGGSGGFGGGDGGSNVSNSRGGGGGGAGMGGAIFSDAGMLTVKDSTLSANFATGGAAGTSGAKPATVGQGYGGGIFARNASVTVNNATLNQNSVTDGAGATVVNGGGSLYLLGDGTSINFGVSNSIFANTTANNSAADAFVNTINGGSCLLMVSNNNNLVEVNGSTPGADANDLPGVTQTADPNLAALTGAACQTATHAIDNTSPAYNNGGGNCEATDQRGLTRPQGAACDIGAYEILVPIVAPTVNKVTITDPAVCTGPGNLVNVTAQVTNPNTSPQTVTFTATLPTQLQAVPGTCAANPAGTFTNCGGLSVVWTGSLTSGQTVTITYQAQVANGTPPGTQLCISSMASISANVSATVPACVNVNCPTVGPGTPPPAAAAISDQKPGSVLFYNLYTSNPADLTRQNTRINLTNTDPSRSVAVHLFFVDGSSCTPADSYLCLTPNQTISFTAADVDPGTTGYIIAVASDSITGCPINFNFLIGDEFVKLASGHQANLGAEAFAALTSMPPVPVACSSGSLTATLNFDGITYNQVPRVLAVDNFPSTADGNNTLLILNRVGGDLASGASTLGALFGVLYDEAEQPFSFTLSGPNCQLQRSLSNSFPRTTPPLNTVISAGRTGWLRLWGVEDIGLLGSVINFNASAGVNNFSQGHNLHKLTFTTRASLTIPIIPPACQ